MSSVVFVTKPTPVISDWRELATRENDGLVISLLWSKAADEVKVTIEDSRRNDTFEFDVAAAEALAAFYHPFAYAACQRLCRGTAAYASYDLQPQG